MKATILPGVPDARATCPPPKIGPYEMRDSRKISTGGNRCRRFLCFGEHCLPYPETRRTDQTRRGIRFQGRKGISP